MGCGGVILLLQRTWMRFEMDLSRWIVFRWIFEVDL